MVDANIIGIVIRNNEGSILEANDAFLRIVGYDREDLVAGRAAVDGSDSTGMTRPHLHKPWLNLRIPGPTNHSRRNIFAKTAAAYPC